MENRNNSFDLIRHFAALMVLVSHHYVLSGKAEPALKGVNTLGGIAVLSFFAISGFLITQSFVRSSLQSYAIKRAARIFPALIACSFVMVYVVGGLFNKEGPVAFAGSFEALSQFLQISAFGRANIDGVTQGFIFSESLNGSLWTLKFEFGCYVLVAIALSLVPRRVVPLLALAGLCVVNMISASSTHPLAGKIAIYSSVCLAFFVGSTLYYYQSLIGSLSSRVTTAAVGVVFIIASTTGLLPLALSTIGFSLLTLAVGTIVADKVIRSRFDISYGLYLYAFPVQQILINCTHLGFYQSMIAAILVTALLAAVSWICIEKPALKYAHSFKRPSKADTEAEMQQG